MFATLLLAAQEVNVKAKNPILPEGKELLWGSISFLIVFVAPGVEGVAGDQGGPRGPSGHASAKTSTRRSRHAWKPRRRSTSTSVSSPTPATTPARSSRRPGAQADSVRQERIAAVEGEIAELRARAAEDIRLATERAMADLQGRVAELSIELAEKVVERNLDRQTQTALIESYINQVGSN